MGALTTFRVHPLVHASYLPSVVPVLVLGASGTLPGAALIAYGCYVVLAHANLRFTFGPLGRVFIAMITVTFQNGIIGDASGSGYELNIALAALALVFAILGTGRFSLDQVLRPLFVKDRQAL
jgi:uncharacterized membrane protein YphA (DoxX/SURF4 family)